MFDRLRSRVIRDFEGATFQLNPADNFTEKYFWLHGNPPESASIKSLIDLFRGQDVTIVDVGANAGIFSIPILFNASPSSTAIMVEPNPIMQKRLEINIALNSLENIRVEKCAVSDWTGTTELHFPANENMGEVRIETAHSAKSSNAGLTADVTTLSNLVKNLEKIDFLKVDVEGVEDRVIGPLLEEAQNLPEYIYFEVAHQQLWKYPLFELLTKNGYSCIGDFSLNQLWKC